MRQLRDESGSRLEAAGRCLEQVLGLEHAANIAPLLHVGAYYCVFTLLIIPGFVNGTLLKLVLYVMLLCLDYSVTVGIFHLHSHRKLFGPSSKRLRGHAPRSLRHRVSNRLLELVLTFPSLGTLSDFEVFHIDHHHRFNNSDLDFGTTRGYEHGWRALWYWFTFSARVRWYVLKRLYLVHTPSLPRRLRRHQVLMLIDLTIGFTLVMTLTLVWPQRMVLCWWIPALFTALNAGFFSWITHAPAKQDESIDASVNTVNNVMNMLMFNQGYHAIHHQYPGIHWSEIPDKLEELPAVDDKYIVPYWVTLFSIWRILLPEGFVDARFGRCWKKKLSTIQKSGRQPRLSWMPYFAWV